MKNIISIMLIAIIASFAGACKTKQAESKKISVIAENPSGKNMPVENNLADKHWKLVELFGNQVTSDENTSEAYIIFNTVENKFGGNAGCNRITGTYQLNDHNRISFSQTATTKKMCINGMDTENNFLQALNKADSYIINHDTLILNKARMAPLARFVIQK